MGKEARDGVFEQMNFLSARQRNSLCCGCSLSLSTYDVMMDKGRELEEGTKVVIQNKTVFHGNDNVQTHLPFLPLDNFKEAYKHYSVVERETLFPIA